MRDAIVNVLPTAIKNYLLTRNIELSAEWLSIDENVGQIWAFLARLATPGKKMPDIARLEGLSNEEIDESGYWIGRTTSTLTIDEALTGKSREAHYGTMLEELFGEIVETTLIQPTFILDYPKSISPLSKASPENAQIAERFELFINGMEVANGFSELNDPKEQYDRFVDQMKRREKGDEEAMSLDEDYIRALSYGMPPTAGIGIGIDRLVMLLTNRHSIRDVILFPHMRPESQGG